VSTNKFNLDQNNNQSRITESRKISSTTYQDIFTTNLLTSQLNPLKDIHAETLISGDKMAITRVEIQRKVKEKRDM